MSPGLNFAFITSPFGRPANTQLPRPCGSFLCERTYGESSKMMLILCMLPPVSVGVLRVLVQSAQLVQQVMHEAAPASEIGAPAYRSKFAD